MRVILASNNENKLREMQAILSPLGWEILRQKDVGLHLEPDENGTTWQILSDQEFAGRPCSRILSTFQNVNAEYVLMLSDDGSAYIITMITFNGQAPDSALEGITFTEYGTAAATPAPSDDAGASTTSEPTAQADSRK